MRTMFASQQLNPGKKKFQKPNILRRKSKASVQRPDASRFNTSHQVVNSVSQPESFNEKSLRLHVEIARPDINNSFLNIDSKEKKYIVSSLNKECTEPKRISFGGNINNVCFDNKAIKKTENVEEELLNVESFLNGGSPLDETEAVQTKCSTLTKEYWCIQLFDSKGSGLDAIPNDGSQLSNLDQKSDISDAAVASTALSLAQCTNLNSSNNVETTVPPSGYLLNNSINKTVQFKCDEPNCKIGFPSELKLNIHKDTHNKQSKLIIADVTAECPVKKVNDTGVEEVCGRIFLSTEDLLKHLNEDHTPNNGVYRCAECGVVSLCGNEASGVARRGGETCAQGRSSRRPLTCTWPGCGRVFRQPCRLREHARSHTGDRPYPCLFPGCSWSFRSASKLQRHTRRHTGDRRYTCASCGRAFLRREHLRDHCARTHPDSSQAIAHEPRVPSTIRVCNYPECGETFLSANARKAHMRKMHKNIESSKLKKCRGDAFTVNMDTSTSISETVLAERSIIEEMQLENGNEVTVDSSGECTGIGEELHAARTHCTWPLTPRHRSLYGQSLDSAYVLEDDIPIEQSESSESNIYTIRSDLFLHGNVLINEDSEFVVSREYLGRSSGAVLEGADAEDARDHSGTGHALDAGLDLIDSHPTIDLMQEELMYADTAVDESSFRVFFA